MRAAVCVGDAHVRGRGAVFTSWHARGPGVGGGGGGGGGDSICGLTAKQRVRVARACVWPRRRFGLRSSDSDACHCSSVVRQRQGRVELFPVRHPGPLHIAAPRRSRLGSR